MDKVRVVLLASTGFGNNTFDVLAKTNNIKLEAVFTPKRHKTPFPYYHCPQLQDVVLAQAGRVKLFEGFQIRTREALGIIKEILPDLIVVSTFSQIIPKDIISVPKLGVINIHPSLLPKYRGPTPTVWAILNGENKTGVSVHYIEDECVDNGPIIAQSKVVIRENDTDGLLRRKLAKCSEGVLKKALTLVLAKKKNKFPKQKEAQSSYYPKISVEDTRIKFDRSSGYIMKMIRAMTPYPGARIICDGREYVVVSASSVRNIKKSGSFRCSSGTIYRKVKDGFVKFHLKMA